MAPNRMRECARLVLLGGSIALCAFLYAWQHFQAIQLRYQLESLRVELQPFGIDVTTTSAPLPKNASYWGWHLDDAAKPVRYSLRTALDALQQALLDLPEPAGVAA